MLLAPPERSGDTPRPPGSGRQRGSHRPRWPGRPRGSGPSGANHPSGTDRDNRLPGYKPDPWRRAPTEELQDQVLPRWFVLLGITAVIAAVATLVAALLVFGPSEVPVAERRPPPPDGSAPALIHAVGELRAGGQEPTVYTDACPALEGVRIAGSPADLSSLRRGLAGACNVASGDVRSALSAFADDGGIVRFAAFEQTGVASTATVGSDPPVIYLNARYSRTDPLQISPLVIHDALARTDPGDARTELSARIAEADACSRLFGDLPPSCADAVELSTLPNALAALRDAGYR